MDHARTDQPLHVAAHDERRTPALQQVDHSVGVRGAANKEAGRGRHGVVERCHSVIVAHQTPLATLHTALGAELDKHSVQLVHQRDSLGHAQQEPTLQNHDVVAVALAT